MASGFPFEMAGGVPIVAAPAEIDTTTAGQLRAILSEWHSRGPTTVVVDLTGTQFCDSTGLRELIRAHKRAVAGGGELCLVIPADGVLVRIFTVTGLDGIIPRFATVGQALARVRAAAARPLRLGTALADAPAGTPAGPRGRDSLVTISRDCQQCGRAFVPRREHARFCGGECRAAWNRAHFGDPAVDLGALTWSITAMSEATARLPAVRSWDREQAFAAIKEAVWWITMVDATLLRHYQCSYDTVLAAHDPGGRQRLEETLAGLRFVRNQMSSLAGLGGIIESGAGARRITGWTWRPLGEPALAWLPPRSLAWELARYRAYQARLARHTIGATFGPAVNFLTLTGADAASATDASRNTPPRPGQAAPTGR